MKENILVNSFPIFVNIDEIEFTKEKIAIKLNCSLKVDVNDLEAVAFGKDQYGETTDLRKKIRFIRNEGSKASGSVTLVKPDAKSNLLDVTLYSKNQKLEDKVIRKTLSNSQWQPWDQQTELKIKNSGVVMHDFKNLELNIFKYDFALSFAKQDRPIAEKLFHLLRGNSNVFYDKDVEHILLGRKVDQVLRNVY